MVDYIKLLIIDTPASILEANPLLDFYDRINLSTGEIKTTNRQGNKITPNKIAYYNDLEFIIYESGTITLSGSLHKYWNNGKHNYNDFDIYCFNWVLVDLCNKFKISLENCILKCLEIGINIIPIIPTNHFLNYSYLHKTKGFEFKYNSDEGKYKQVQHSQYIIKLYNKSLHYRSKGYEIETEIMRFEIKYTKMQKLNEKGIYTLNDLKNYGLHHFKKELLTEFNNILYYDTTIQYNSKSLTNYKDLNYWTGLIDNKQTELFKYHRNQLNKITALHSENIKQKTVAVISKKIDYLNTNTTRIDPLVILSNQVVNTTLNNTYKRRCKITGLDISIQKDNSIYLSHTGLRYYFETDIKVYEQVKRKYLSQTWYNTDFENEIKEIAHNIRNTSSNQSIKQHRLYRPQQYNILSFFDIKTPY